VEAKPEEPEQDVLSGTLSKAKGIVEEIHDIVNAKLVKQRGDSTQIRRTAWVRYKPKIITLCDDLKEARGDLLVALCADISLVYFTAFSSHLDSV